MLQNQHDKIINENEDISKKIKELAKENKELEVLTEIKSDEFERIQKYFEDEIQIKSENINSMESKLKEEEQKGINLNLQEANLQRQLRILEEENANDENEYRLLKTENVDIQIEFDNLKTEKTKIQQHTFNLKQEFCKIAGKLEELEQHFREELETFKKEMQEIDNNKKTIENEASGNIKKITEEMNTSKLKFDQETKRIDNHYKDLVNSVEAELHVKEAERDELKIDLEKRKNEMKKVCLDINILNRQIEVWEQMNKNYSMDKPKFPPLRSKGITSKMLPIVPKKRNFDEYSDSSAEGVAYNTKQFLAFKQKERKKINNKQ